MAGVTDVRAGATGPPAWHARFTARRARFAAWRGRYGLPRLVRGFFLLNALFNAVLTVAQLTFRADGGPWLRALAAAAVVALGGWWTYGYRRDRFPAVLEPFEWLLNIVVAVAFGHSLDALALYYAAIVFRSNYGGLGVAVLRASVAAPVLVAMPLLVQELTRSRDHDTASIHSQVPAALILIVVVYLLGTSLRRQERAAVRDRVLTRTGTMLTTTHDPAAIHERAVTATVTLIDPEVRTRAVLTDADGTVLAEAGTCEPATDCAPLVLPLRTKYGVIGALTVITDRPIRADVQVSVETLRNQVALGLEASALTRELTRQAYHDSLTGLANRSRLHEHVGRALDECRSGGPPAGLLLIGMDGFKLVNDTLGHGVGDRLLIALGERLQRIVREPDLICRLAGDEFAVALCQSDGEPIGPLAEMVAQRVVDSLREPLQIDGHQLVARVSIGITTTDDLDPETADADTFLRNADVAMYQAKALGTHGWQRYEQRMHLRGLDRRALEADLHHALGRSELVVHYQPIRELRSNRIVGVEALIRWQHPTRGLVPPGDFIPLAEETRLIDPIGDWVLREACRQAVSWQAARPGQPPLRVSVNLSPVQLDRTDLADRIAATLHATGLTPALLELEITESVFVRDVDTVRVTLDRLKALGVRLAIDDFGTGYSSLSYLQRLPIDTLKIDRSFVSGESAESTRAGATTPGRLLLAEAIVRLSQTLDMVTVAEGIETAEQADLLRSFGCEYGQGWHLARPADAATVGGLLDVKDPVTAQR